MTRVSSTSKGACMILTTRQKSRKGFTLVELLVVISIIALLIAILLPSLAKARTASRGVHCLNNLRQVYMSMTMYGGEYKDYYPEGYNPQGGWPWAIGRYAGEHRTYAMHSGGTRSTPYIVMCPLQTLHDIRSSVVASDYIVNGWALGRTGGGLTARISYRIADVPSTSTFMLMTDGVDPSIWINRSYGIDLRDELTHAVKIGALHLGSSNMLFADGHAAPRRFPEGTSDVYYNTQNGRVSK